MCLCFPYPTLLQAKELQIKNVNYIVKGEEVIIVDEFTGRTMVGRRWSDGLHQAVEAKEGLPIQTESVTLASISYQAFFRGFPKLAGMTGTAATEVSDGVYGAGRYTHADTGKATTDPVHSY